MKFKYHHLHLLCSDLNTSIYFFKDLLGATLSGLKKFGAADGAMLELSGIKIFLRSKSENESIEENLQSISYGYDHLALEVDDINKAYRTLTKEGYQFSSPPDINKTKNIIFLKGPDNITIELIG